MTTTTATLARTMEAICSDHCFDCSSLDDETIAVCIPYTRREDDGSITSGYEWSIVKSIKALYLLLGY